MRGQKSAIASMHNFHPHDTGASSRSRAAGRQLNAMFAHSGDRHPTWGLAIAMVSSLAIWAAIGVVAL
jgi:hypothetical protein